MKKFYKITLILLILIIIIFFANVYKKYYILTKFNESLDLYKSSKNLYFSFQFKNIIQEYYSYNDKKAILLSFAGKTLPGSVKYSDSTGKYEINYTSGSIKKLSDDYIISAMISRPPEIDFSNKNTRIDLAFSFNTKISSAEYKGKPCYSITLLEYNELDPTFSYTVYLTKDTYTPVYTNWGGTEMEYDIKLNAVTEEDLNFPTTEEELQEIINKDSTNK